MSDGNQPLHSERRANTARRTSRCIFQRPPLESLTRLEGLKTKAPRTGIIGPGLTGGLAPSTPEPAPSHRPLYLPQERDSPGNPLHSIERFKTPSRSVTFLRGTTIPISVTFLNGLTGTRGTKSPRPVDPNYVLGLRNRFFAIAYAVSRTVGSSLSPWRKKQASDPFEKWLAWEGWGF